MYKNAAQGEEHVHRARQAYFIKSNIRNRGRKCSYDGGFGRCALSFKGYIICAS